MIFWGFMYGNGDYWVVVYWLLIGYLGVNGLDCVLCNFLMGVILLYFLGLCDFGVLVIVNINDGGFGFYGVVYFGVVYNLFCIGEFSYGNEVGCFLIGSDKSFFLVDGLIVDWMVEWFLFLEKFDCLCWDVDLLGMFESMDEMFF